MKTFYRSHGTLLCIRGIPLPIFLLVFLLTLLSADLFAQVNAYASVTAISTTGGRSRLTVTNVNQSYHTFAVGEQVIVIQMQDNVINGTSNNSSFGLLGSSIQKAGTYEVGTIYQLTSTTITLTTTLGNTFNFNSNSSVQVVSFTTLGGGGNFTTTGNISAVDWNGSSGTGGVVAIQVGGTLTLRHSITADGQGFAGGAASTDDDESCDPDTYRTNNDKYGAKGEGIFLRTSNNQINGRARIVTGGGGGNPNNGGGAGGGNYTAGGSGGPGWTCGSNPSGGLGGVSLSTYITAGSRAFMGGGGGGGQGNNGYQTAGSRGGGIIIIKAATLTTDCSLSSAITISANGADASNTTGGGNDGAGGAGAAGTIVFQVGAYTVPIACKLHITANGGNGGSVTNADSHGGGGGGGQGAIIFTTASPNPNMSYHTEPGVGGLNSSAGTDRAGSGSGAANIGVIGGVGVVLPVSVTYFGAEKKDNQALLSWTSTDDYSSITYRVQHSTDGIHFTTIGTVNGTGNGTSTSRYSFTDANPATGINYYRLEIAGSASGLSYSGIASINLAETQRVAVAYPNPAHNYFNIRVSGLNNSTPYTVTVSDLAGHIILTTSQKPAGGLLGVSLTQAVKPGLYMYRINGTDIAGKLMIQ